MKTITTISLVAALAASGAVDAMKDMGSGSKAAGTPRNGAVHKASAVVTAVDRATGKVTLAHGPINSLKWPAMRMGFPVKDKSLFDKLKVGQKIDVEITQQGSEYVVTAVNQAVP